MVMGDVYATAPRLPHMVGCVCGGGGVQLGCVLPFPVVLLFSYTLEDSIVLSHLLCPLSSSVFSPLMSTLPPTLVSSPLSPVSYIVSPLLSLLLCTLVSSHVSSLVCRPVLSLFLHFSTLSSPLMSPLLFSHVSSVVSSHVYSPVLSLSVSVFCSVPELCLLSSISVH